MLEHFKKSPRSAFIPYLVAGYPSWEVCEATVDILVEEGADFLELGVPFSDAMADGPVIQKASEKVALGCDSVVETLRFAAHLHKKHPSLGLILFTYLNPVFRLSFKAFATSCRESGIQAALIVDLPVEEAADYLHEMNENLVKTIFLASPTTSPKRLLEIAEASTGFIYYISRLGVTGVQLELSSTLESELQEIRRLTERSIAVGFGISNGNQVSQVANWADGVVVGSAFTQLLSQKSNTSDFPLQAVRSLAREIRSRTSRNPISSDTI